MACVLWVIDINPYSKQLQVYKQSCEEMILDNSYCNSKWVDDPVITYLINSDQSTVTKTNKPPIDNTIYNNCSINDRKNWSCVISEINESIFSVDGIITDESEDTLNIGKRHITRLQWLQHRFLEKLGANY